VFIEALLLDRSAAPVAGLGPGSAAPLTAS
jgi:hypothetical protein